jgi:Zn-dependent protease
MFGGPSFKLFSVLGFRVGAHWSLPLALVLAAFSFGGLGGVALSVSLFASILAHELGHAVVARRLRVPIEGIDLHMFGGVAKMKSPPRSPNDEIAISIAGPIVSLALAAAFFVALAVVPAALLPAGAAGLVKWLAGANLMLGLFNLLPALPLDGGRVFRALLAKRKGLVGGTRTAVKVSRGIAVALGVFGIATGSFWLVMLAALVWMMGTAELNNVAAHDAMTRMGAWHPNHVPWVSYDVAANEDRRAHQRAASGAGPFAGRVREPDDVIVIDDAPLFGRR